MKARPFDGRHLDVVAFAEHNGALAGDLPLAQLRRLSEFAAPEAPPGPQDQVAWQARGEFRPVRSGPPQVWLHLEAQATLAMTCQRCLQPLAVSLAVSRDIRFVEGEEAAAAEDDQSEDDVLATTATLSLPTLVEDELVLALPWVPRHEVCVEPLPQPKDELADDPPPNPFAALAQLKKRLDS
jgi:uncharacterized protein